MVNGTGDTGEWMSYNVKELYFYDVDIVLNNIQCSLYDNNVQQSRFLSLSHYRNTREYTKHEEHLPNIDFSFVSRLTQRECAN